MTNKETYVQKTSNIYGGGGGQKIGVNLEYEHCKMSPKT